MGRYYVRAGWDTAPTQSQSVSSIEPAGLSGKNVRFRSLRFSCFIQAALITRSSSGKFGGFPYISEASRNILAAKRIAR